MSRRDWTKVLEAIASGQSLRKACGDAGLGPMALLAAAEHDHELGIRYAQARISQAHHDASEIDEATRELLTLARTSPGTLTMPQVNAYRSAIDALKWTAARKHPAVYADRVQVEQRTAQTVTVLLGKAPSVGVIDTIPVVQLSDIASESGASLPKAHTVELIEAGDGGPWKSKDDGGSVGPIGGKAVAIGAIHTHSVTPIHTQGDSGQPDGTVPAGASETQLGSDYVKHVPRKRGRPRRDGKVRAE